MKDWNVVVTVNEDGYRRVRRMLAPFGAIASTDYYNVMVMRVADPAGMMTELASCIEESPGLMNDLSRVIPAAHTFNFQNAEEFEEHARAIVLDWLTQLAGRTFYVRLHRRGFKGTLSSPQEERFLDEVILSGLQKLNAPGQISFEDPDAVIDIETVGNRAGISLWTREDLQRFTFLRPD
jgi:tRNA(Ser,Leu) C12 N-acetylase TAN1